MHVSFDVITDRTHKPCAVRVRAAVENKKPPPFAESGRCDAPRLVALKAAPIAGCTQGAAANRPAVRTFETLVADIPAEPAPRLTQGLSHSTGAGVSALRRR